MRQHRLFFAIAMLTAAIGLSGCGSNKLSSVSVQSVAMICGFTELTQSQQFSGIVSTGKEENVARDSDKKIAVVYVKQGDQVKEGDKLFTYDSEQANNSLERAKLELEEMKNGQASKEIEKKQLETDKTKAAQSEQMDYTLKIQEVETDIRENAYNMALKEKEIQRLEDSMKNLDVTAPISGRIEKAGAADANTGGGSAFGDEDAMDAGGYDDTGSDENDASAFIKIVEIDNYRVKGSINEQNIQEISTGMNMIICSRVDSERTWRGTVTSIEMTPEKNSENDNYYYGGGGDEMTTTSKYPFYVSIEQLDGLMIGQHVYMRADLGEYENAEDIRLDASFINDADTSPWIWAESAQGLLEKRNVSIDAYEEADNTWLVTDGITADDYIAPSSDAYEVGMACIENNNTAFEASDNTGEDAGFEEGEEDFGDEEYYGDEEYFDEDEDFTYEGEEDYFFDDEDIDFEDEGVGGDIGTFGGNVFGGGAVG